MKILDQFPIADRERAISVPGNQYLTAKPYQTIVTVSLQVRNSLSPAFPAILDTGHNHNFSISEDQLRTWAKIDPTTLAPAGRLGFEGKMVILRAADVVLYCNQKGSYDLSGRSYKFPFENDRGISVHEIPIARWPILGIRGILRRKLVLTFDGDQSSVSLETPSALRSLKFW